MVDPAAPKKSASKKRLQWEDLPSRTQADIARLANGRVVAAANCTGGFSPGLASRLELADGSRVFVKAMDAVEWPDQATWYRTEALVSQSLPPDVPAPRLRGWSDDGRWVMLVFEHIDGAEPDLRGNPSHAWPHARLGAPFLDLIMFASSAGVEGIESDQLLAARAATAGHDPYVIDAIIAAHAGFCVGGSLWREDPEFAPSIEAKAEFGPPRPPGCGAASRVAGPGSESAPPVGTIAW